MTFDLVLALAWSSYWSNVLIAPMDDAERIEAETACDEIRRAVDGDEVAQAAVVARDAAARVSA